MQDFKTPNDRDVSGSIAAISDVALSYLGLEEFLTELLKRVRDMMRADSATVLLLDSTGDYLAVRASNGLEEEVSSRVRIPVGRGVAGRIVAQAAPMLIPDLSKVEVFSSLLLSLRSLVGVPLLVGGRAIGVLHTGSSKLNAFNAGDVQMLRLVADRVALAIERARLLEVEREAVQTAIAAMTRAQEESEAREKAEQALRRSSDELEVHVQQRTAELAAANRELEAFSYSVSHDLRAPLRAIDGFSQILLESYGHVLDEQGRHYLARVRSNSQRMSQLIDDMLSLSRLTRATLQRSPVDLTALALLIADNLQKTHADRTVHFECAPDLHTSADPHLLRIALENLLDNAWKFTATRPHASVTMGMVPGEVPATYFVRDNGVGFDMTYASRLFAPFQRLHTEQQFSGSGIGLATVHRVFTRHDGRVWVDSTINEGTTFFFTLGSK